jgi:DNA (cytosine-5)-methyltransferase 1
MVAKMAAGAMAPFPIWSDVASMDGRPWRGLVDLISAGYPCQPFSQAGKRLGEADPRHLWPHIGRIISECEPEWVFLENVAAHLHRGFRSVAADLQRMGYRVAAGIFTALEVGAPHLRKRLFAVARDEALAYADGARLEGRRALWEGAGKFATGEGGAPPHWHSVGSPEPCIRRVADGIRDRDDRLRALGNAVCPQQAALAFGELKTMLLGGS